jgi:hypothetical protein
VKSNCNPVTIKFTEKGKTDAQWISGLSWGVCLCDPVRLRAQDQGALFTIRLTQQPAPTRTIGPNKVLKPPYVRPPPQSCTTLAPSRPHKSASIATPGPPGTGSSLGRPSPTTGSTDPLWNLVNAAFLTLSHTSPNMTTSCWLCYDVRTPFYEAIGLNATYNVSTSENPTHCSWGNCKRGLTIQQVSSQRTCLRKVPAGKQDLCAVVDINPTWGDGIKWVIPKDNGWWICSQSGLTPCLSTDVFNGSREFCVLAAVLPHIIYHSEESLHSH